MYQTIVLACYVVNLKIVMFYKKLKMTSKFCIKQIKNDDSNVVINVSVEFLLSFQLKGKQTCAKSNSCQGKQTRANHSRGLGIRYLHHVRLHLTPFLN